MAALRAFLSAYTSEHFLSPILFPVVPFVLSIKRGFFLSEPFLYLCVMLPSLDSLSKPIFQAMQ